MSTVEVLTKNASKQESVLRDMEGLNEFWTWPALLHAQANRLGTDLARDTCARDCRFSSHHDWAYP